MKCQKALLLLLVAFVSSEPLAFAQSAGLAGQPSNGSNVPATQQTDSSTILAPTAPFLPLAVNAKPNQTLAGSVCPDVACVGGHACQCWSANNIPINLPTPITLIAAHMNVEINLDLSESLATVFGVCDAAYGQGNATTPAGAVLKINFTGQFCTDFSTMTFGGPWWV